MPCSTRAVCLALLERAACNNNDNNNHALGRKTGRLFFSAASVTSLRGQVSAESDTESCRHETAQPPQRTCLRRNDWSHVACELTGRSWPSERARKKLEAATALLRDPVSICRPSMRRAA
jgi:hypothetical protein